MDISAQTPLCRLRRRLPHEGGDWPRRMKISPLVGETPAQQAEGGLRQRLNEERPT